MTREELKDIVLESKHKSLLIEAGTGVGKTSLALAKVKQLKPKSILVVVPRLVLIDNWKEEFVKWKAKTYLDRTTFTTYASLHKYAESSYDIVIFDECHHLTQRCREIIPTITSKQYILLSATVARTLKDEFHTLFPDIHNCNVSLKDAIDSGILVEPKILLVPLTLNTSFCTEILTINPQMERFKSTTYAKWRQYKWQYLKSRPDYGVQVLCTQWQYYQEISDTIGWYKSASNNMRKPRILRDRYKKIYLHKCKERLTWLAEIKSDYVKTIVSQLQKYRTLTFCANIAQTKQVGEYCITSDDKKQSMQYYQDFNDKKIDHITACNMLNEGCNLTACQIGIFAVINASDLMNIQKMGRILRHEKPIIIIPYFTNTREVEIVKDIISNYEESAVSVVTDYRNIGLNEYLN